MSGRRIRHFGGFSPGYPACLERLLVALSEIEPYTSVFGPTSFATRSRWSNMCEIVGFVGHRVNQATDSDYTALAGNNPDCLILSVAVIGVDRVGIEMGADRKLGKLRRFQPGLVTAMG
jgi:hypothetical protein